MCDPGTNSVWKKSISQTKTVFLSSFHLPGSCLKKNHNKNQIDMESTTANVFDGMQFHFPEYKYPGQCGKLMKADGEMIHLIAYFYGNLPKCDATANVR